MNILILSHTFPYPPNEGIKLPLYNLIKEFSKRNKVSLLSFVTEEEKKYVSEIEKYVEKISLVEHYPSKNFFKRSFSVFFSKHPYCVEQFFSHEFVERLKEFITQEKFDVLFFDFINTVMYEKFVRKDFKGKKILFLHDAMSMLFYRNFLVTKSIVKKYYWFNQYLKLLNFEFGLQNNFDKIVVVAEKDKDWLVEKSNVARDKIVVIPNGVDTEY
ncbi:MAG: glycosyltransferase, partial [Endomicrobiia bacterium]